MDTFELRWKMGNVGSADLVVGFSQEFVEVHTTYVGYGLGSLVRAAADLRLGSSSAIAYLPGEPGGTCLFFGGAGEVVYLQVVHFSRMDPESSRWSGGSLRWQGQVGVREFIRCVVSMADEVLVSCGGQDGYMRAWGGISFPAREVEALRQD